MAKQIRYSRQRERIYNYLMDTKEHPSAEKIYEELKSEIPELSLGTVYRNLKLLEELGQICRVASVNGVERYDANCSAHAHFICDNCEAVIDLDADFEKLCSEYSEDYPGKVRRVVLTMYGLCEKCMSKGD